MLRERVRLLEAGGAAPPVIADPGLLEAKEARIAVLVREVHELKLANEQLRHRLNNATQTALHNEVTRVLLAAGLAASSAERNATSGDDAAEGEAGPAPTGEAPAALVEGFLGTISHLRSKLQDLEDQLELERTMGASRRRKARSSGSKGKAALTDDEAMAVTPLTPLTPFTPAAGGGDNDDGEAADADAVHSRLQASLQLVEDDLARSRRYMEELDSDVESQAGDLADEVERLRSQLERTKREKDEAVAKARALPNAVWTRQRATGGQAMNPTFPHAAPDENCYLLFWQETMRATYETKIRQLTTQLDEARRKQREVGSCCADALLVGSTWPTWPTHYFCCVLCPAA